MKLHDKVAFDEPQFFEDGSGGKEAGWVEYYECRANIRYLRGGERVQASRLDGRQPVVISVRNSSQARGIDTNFRVRDLVTGAEYNVRAGAVETTDRKYLEFTAESGVAI